MDRRRFIAGAGGVVATSGFASTARSQTDGQFTPPDTCRQTIRLTEGPFLTESPLRSDIRDGRPGVPLHLKLNVMNQYFCTPIEGAVVDIWQCDASGRYSAVENLEFDMRTMRVKGTAEDLRAEKFLRGHQISDENGNVSFTTIIPGWYGGRIPHIHVRTVQGPEWTSHVTQLFIPHAIEREVFAQGAYAGRGQNPMPIERDLAVKGDKSIVDALTIAMDKKGDGFAGEYTIAMDAI